MLLNLCSNDNIILMENVAIKGRGGNDLQHKNWNGKILNTSGIHDHAPAADWTGFDLKTVQYNPHGQN